MRPTPSCRRLPESVAVLALLLSVGACNDADNFKLGSEAQVDWYPSSVVFNDVPRDEQAYRVVTIRHIGTNGTIRLDPITLESESDDLSIFSIEKSELTPGDETRIQILYSSGEDAPDAGELRIGMNVAATPLLTIPISTPGQRGELVASPGSVDFGIVQAGAPGQEKVEITNVGTAPAELTGFTVAGDKDGDFSVDMSVGVVIQPKASVDVTMVYAPTDKDDDQGLVTLTTDREDVSVTIPVEGEEETPILVVQPAIVQLGWTQPGEQRLVTLKMRNEGTTSLWIHDIDLKGAVDGVVLSSVPPIPAAGLELEPGGLEKLGVVFEPATELPMSGNPIANIVIDNTDEAHNPMTVPIYGAAGTPSIEVIPPDAVDFAFVAEGFVAKRQVTVINAGSSEIEILDADLADPTSDEFDFPDADLLPTTLKPGENVDLTLTFENTGGTKGTEFAQFLLHTDDPLVPEYPLDVVARRSERPSCEPAFVPEILALGAHKEGSSHTGQLHIVNFGSGKCIYKSHEVTGCDKVQLGMRHRFDCDPFFPGTPFSVTGSPATDTELHPGESIAFDITFDAPQVENIDLGRDLYFGKITSNFQDPNLGGTGFVFVAPPGGWMKGVNLRAESATPIAAIDPPAVDFGTVRTGCESKPNNAFIASLGPLPVSAGAVTPTGCGPDVKTQGHPAVPFEVGGFEQLALEVVWSPSEGTTSPLQCTLHFETDAANLPEFDMALSGVPIDVDHQTDVFTQAPTPNVDVLFVVDDSGSMHDEQQLLKKELPQLVEMAVSWGQSYHLAVTTTDMQLVNGKFQGYPPYVSDEYVKAVMANPGGGPVIIPDPEADNEEPTEGGEEPAPGSPSEAEVAREIFGNNLIVGITGSGEEMGQEAAWHALIGANVATSNNDCIAGIPNQCPIGMLCHDGLCRGTNWGFLREDADLVVIIVSDEEDSSPQANEFYTTALAGLKNPQKGYGVKVHTVSACPDQTIDCFCPGFHFPSFRYPAQANMFGGVAADLCALEFADEFADIAAKSFGLKDQFYPSLPVDVPTLQVRIDGVVCAEGQGWTWNEETHAVVFDEAGACFPQHGSEVELEYDVACFVE